MAAFGASQGGKAPANESKPKQGLNPTTSESPKGQAVPGEIHKGYGGSKKGFGA